jgi:hypothetical protein
MARNIRLSRLETRTSRLKLPIAKKPIYVKIDRGIALGYRRNRGPGTWVMRVTRDGEDWTDKIGIADDFEDAATERTLTFWTAQARARELALGGRETGIDPSKPPRSLPRSMLTKPTCGLATPTSITSDAAESAFRPA